jgi:hypothetical protein
MLWGGRRGNGRNGNLTTSEDANGSADTVFNWTCGQPNALNLATPDASLARGIRFAEDSPLEGAGFEPSVPRESNGEKAKEPVSLAERKVPEMSSTGRRLSIFTSGFSRD